MARCQANNAKGKQCAWNAVPGNEYCSIHAKKMQGGEKISNKEISMEKVLYRVLQSMIHEEVKKIFSGI